MKSIKLLLLICALFTLASCSHGCKKHGDKANRGHHKEMWKKMDANGDGFLSKAEFGSAHKASFKEMDKNSDGKISKEEMKKHHKAKKGDKKSCCK